MPFRHPKLLRNLVPHAKAALFAPALSSPAKLNEAIGIPVNTVKDLFKLRGNVSKLPSENINVGHDPAAVGTAFIKGGVMTSAIRVMNTSHQSATANCELKPIDTVSSQGRHLAPSYSPVGRVKQDMCILGSYWILINM